MNNTEKRLFLIGELIRENERYREMVIPEDSGEQKILLRSLMNVRMPAPLTEEYEKTEDEYLRAEIRDRGITDAEDISEILPGIKLWQGDITLLKIDAIVNAANSKMLGCFMPMHACIDNCIHSYAGLRLRNRMNDIMKNQGHDEPTGDAKITKGYSLPASYIIHTVGPIVRGRLTEKHERLLESCYVSCLEKAREKGLKSIAFCCISTGVFGYPKPDAARTALKTVLDWKRSTGYDIDVVFNVFSDEDLEIYLRTIDEIREKNNAEKKKVQV